MILYCVFRARVSYNISSTGAKGFTRAKLTRAPERSNNIIMEYIISERIIGAVHTHVRIVLYTFLTRFGGIGAVGNFTSPVSHVILFTLDRCRALERCRPRTYYFYIIYVIACIPMCKTNNTNVKRGNGGIFSRKKKKNQSTPCTYNIIHT